MVKILYANDHKYTDPLIAAIEGCIEFQEGYYADESACAEYNTITQTLTVNDLPVKMTDEVKGFFVNYYKELKTKPLNQMQVPEVRMLLTMPDEDDPGYLRFEKDVKLS